MQIIVENEDGDVLKKYDLPGSKLQGDLVSQGLKYMGMGVFAKAVDKSAAAAEAPAEGEGESAAQRARKKSVVEEQQEEDDRHIRFTIGGVGRRMTKEDFIQEMKKLDKPTRREIIDKSNAPQAVRAAARQEPPAINIEHPSVGTGQDSPQHSRASSPGKAPSSETPSGEAAETEVERRRRMAVLEGVSDANEEHDETAAERRRREAALGIVSSGTAEEDSDDDDTPRVPPSRRSIRFADAPERGRK